MVSLPTAVYQGIRQYLPADHDPVEVAVKIATVLSTHRETVPLSSVATSDHADGEPSLQSQSSDPTQASSPVDGSVASEGGAATVIASDNPVKDMPTTPRERANLRLGLTKDGKGRFLRNKDGKGRP